MKYFFKFLMIITRNGSLMPRVLVQSAGQVMKVVLQNKNSMYLSMAVGSFTRLLCKL